jgi:alanyl-tRNA synthetase
MNKMESELRQTAAELRVPLFDVNERAASTLSLLKDLQNKQKRNKQMAAEGEFAQLLASSITASAAGYPLVILRKDGVDAGGMRNAWDIIRAHMDAPGACVLASDNGGTPLLMAAATDEAAAAGFHAGNIIKAIAPAIKGGGGGKPTMAQAGGKDSAGLDDALQEARKLLL